MNDPEKNDTMDGDTMDGDTVDGDTVDGDTVDLDDVQGWVLRGYNKARVRHVALAVRDAGRAQAWLRDTTPRIQTAAPWHTTPLVIVNVAFTFDGLGAMGQSQRTLDEFPTEFKQGMAARAVKLGDVGAAAPSEWHHPYRPDDDGSTKVHAIVTVHADDEAGLDAETARIDRTAFDELARHDGVTQPEGTVFFGYRDGISQPRFRQLHPDHPDFDLQPYSPLGVALLGHRTDFEGVKWETPNGIGHNGSYNAFRILHQDVDGFEAYLADTADWLLSEPAGDDLLPPGNESRFGDGATRHDAMVELLAAKLLGRWRNGNSLITNPDAPGAPLPVEQLSKFDYVDDADGVSCPIGAHVRRNNPRGAKIVQRYATHARRIIRRGTPYTSPSGERGLLGNFIGASLAAQFEALQNDWMNLGLLDPRITGTNDPVLGANDPLMSAHEIPLAGGTSIRLSGFGRFVTPVGGAYTFIPSISALRTMSRA